jgi:hypothetical protein
MKDWIQNKIDLLSTPLGAGIGLGSLIVGIMIGKILMMFANNINSM